MSRTALLSLLPALALGGCMAPAPNAIPVGIDLFQTKLFVEMSNGATCRTDVDLTTGSDAGRVARCATPLQYRIVTSDKTNPLRYVAVAGEEGRGLSEFLTPNAIVTLTKADGTTYEFVAIEFEDERDPNDDP